MGKLLVAMCCCRIDLGSWGAGEVWLIDFELGGPNYRGFDWMKLFRRPEGVSQKDWVTKDLEHFLQSYASHQADSVDLASLLRETLAFEPLTWLEAFVFFLALPKYKPEGVAKWQRLAEHRWEMYQQTRYRLLPCESEWPSLPDVVLLNAAALLGPKEVSSLAVTCSSWAETITNSQAWLWSAVAACSVPSDVCRCLESWCCSKNLPLRQGLQLWLCRAHLWGAPEACFSSPVQVNDSWCGGQSTVCCTSWSSENGTPAVALGFSDGTLHFGALDPGEARGLRGPQPTTLRLDRSVRSAHGRSLVTAVQTLQPYGRAVTSGLDGLLRVWDPETAEEIHQIVTGHQRGLNSVVVSSEAEPRLLTCGDAGEVMIYSPTCLAGAAPLQSSLECCSNPRRGCEEWGGVALQPDLAAFGVLRKKDAALFVEYDGYYLHGTKEGALRDEAKNGALLDFSPDGSLVIRISHTRKGGLKGNVLWLKVDPWRRGDRNSVSKTLKMVLQKVAHGGRRLFRPDVLRRIQQAMQRDPVSVRALDFVNGARVRGCGNTTEEISEFLIDEGFAIRDTGLMLSAGLNGKCITETLQPRIEWLVTLGLTKGQIAKVVAGFPHLLCYSVEKNLQPTAQWLMTLGLTRHQVGKAVAGFPQLFGLSIEQNLGPKVQWLMTLGLTRHQFAKAVAGFPNLLGYSSDQNLQPTVQWLVTLGLTRHQVGKAVAGFPQLFGLSIEQNLRPKVQWLMTLGLTRHQVAKAVAYFPKLLGHSIDQNLQPTVQWLLTLGLTRHHVAKAVAGFPQLFGLSIEQNLRPKVQWLLTLGLSKGQVVTTILIKPQLFGYSLEKNMKPKYELLRRSFGVPGAASLIAKRPTVLGYSMLRVAERMKILAKHNMTAKLASVIDLTEDFYECQEGSSEHDDLFHAAQEQAWLKCTKGTLAASYASFELHRRARRAISAISNLSGDRGRTERSAAPSASVTPAAFNSAVEVTSTSQWLGRTMTEWTKDDLPPTGEGPYWAQGLSGG
eukprot:s178_g22.t1